MKAYFDWHVSLVGFPPKIDGAQGKALKYIIKYLDSITDSKGLESWQAILSHWGSVDKFYQTQTKLTQINSNIQLIIQQIKSGQTKTDSRYLEEIRNRI